MSNLYKTIRKQGLKGEEKVRFAKKLLDECKGFATKVREKMKSNYQTLRKKKRYKQGRYIRQILKIMAKTIGEDKTRKIAKLALEGLKKRPEHTRAENNADVTTPPETPPHQSPTQITPIMPSNPQPAAMDGLANMKRSSVLPDIPSDMVSGVQFVDVHSAELIQKVTSVMPLADTLRSEGMLHEERYSEIKAACTRQEKMRHIFDAVSGVDQKKYRLYQLLQEFEPHLMKELEPRKCSSGRIQAVKDDIRSRILNRKVFEGMKRTEAVDLDEFYTEIHIIGSDFSQVNNNHEIWQVETAHMSNTSEGNVIKYHEIFKPGVGGKRCVKNVLMKGIAGIGKTITVKKYLRDWGEGRNKDDIYFDFVFLFPFRDLNKYAKEKGDCSLFELFRFFNPELREADSVSILESKLLLIFDGLDESDCPLAATSPILTDVKKAASLDVLLKSLMSGKLLPSASLWITTRPAAAAQLPEEILTDGYVAQIQGFNDQQKMKYFEMQMKDKEAARRIISYLKSTRSLDIMCHVPLFCWMSARVLTSSQSVRPKSLTEMYIHFLTTLTGFSHEKYQGNVEVRSALLHKHKGIILKLGKLAFQHLEKPQIYFAEKDFKKCEIDVSDALKLPGLCAELLKMEDGLYSEKSYCFIHLSFQEFLAALYAFHEFSNNNHDTLRYFKPKNGEFSNLADFLNAVVDKVINNNDGHLDLLARFLFGISLDSSKDLLQGFLPDLGRNNIYHKKVARHIKALRRKDLCPDRCLNLVHCLVELDDKSFLKELEHHKTGLAKKPLSPFQCSALVYQLVRSEENLLELDLKQYRLTEDCYLRLTPAIPYFKRVLLNCIGITKKFSPTLALALRVPNAQLTELDLSHNSLRYGMMCLSRGLCSPNCKIEKLNLSHNRLSYMDVEAIRDVLMSSDSRLKDLDLSNNDFQISEVNALCAGLRSCRLSVLRLSGCCISSASFDSLAKALRSESDLEVLDLSYNNPGDSAISVDKLKIVNMDHAGECREKPWLHKYDIDLRLDPETANEYLNVYSMEKMVKRETQKQSYPDHPNRFDQCNQILCEECLEERHYWEVEKTGSEVHVGVAYRSISRKGTGNRVLLGQNSDSWNFFWSNEKGKSKVSHNNISEPISVLPSFKLGIFLDWPAGTLSFYRIAGSMKESEEPEHLYTFHTTFKEPVYPAFRVQNPGTTLILSELFTNPFLTV